MKKLTAFFIGILSICLLSTSCETTTCGPEPPDTSLGASIAFSGYRMDIEGTYDGEALGDFKSDKSDLTLKNEGGMYVSMYCHSTWGRTTFDVSIPMIPISGSSGNVVFDYTTSEAKVMRNETQAETVSASVKGWLKKTEPATGSYPIYTCDIDITCTVDSKPLVLKITAVRP